MDLTLESFSKICTFDQEHTSMELILEENLPHKLPSFFQLKHVSSKLGKFYTLVTSLQLFLVESKHKIELLYSPRKALQDRNVLIYQIIYH